MNRENKIKIFEKIYSFLIIMSMVSIVFVLLAKISHNRIFLLWKEILIILSSFVLLWIRGWKFFKKELILLLCITIIVTLYSLSSPSFYIALYQIKLDWVVLIFVIIFFFFIRRLNSVYIFNLYIYTVKLIIIFGVLNALAAIVEFWNPNFFMEIVGITPGDWGYNEGLRVITMLDFLRSPALLTGFVQAGSFILLSIYLTLFFPFIKGFLRLILFVVLTLGLICTTYKSGIVGLLMLMYIYITELVFSKFKSIFVNSVAIIIFVISLAGSFNEFLFRLFMNINEYIAYNSIYMRFYFTQEILHQMDSLLKIILGVGFGYNGTFGVYKPYEAIPLDSLFLYLLSNYGVLGLVIFLGIMLYAYIKIKNESIFKGVAYYLLYLSSIEFFFNNFLVNFPVNLLVFTLLSFALILSDRNCKEVFKL